MPKSQELLDEFFIRYTFKLARKGLSWTFPNPLVGAILVKDNKIIGKGYHKKFGAPHAEINAINSTKVDMSGSTLYVNLEPCVHFGKTPPCVDTIIKSKVKRVVCSVIDPNPKVGGKGLNKLIQAGIDVELGILSDEARKLNEAFFTFHGKKRPFIALKFAASLDGKIATKTGDSKWITNENARIFARGLRSNYQSILVGINTIIKDNPHLGARKRDKKDPLRIILDSELKIPLNSQVLRDDNVLIFTTENADKERLKILKKKDIAIISCGRKKIEIKKVLSELNKREIISILVEGGSKVLGSFIDQRLVDKVYAFYAPIVIAGEKAFTTIGGNGVKSVGEALRLKNVDIKRFGDNILIVGYFQS